MFVNFTTHSRLPLWFFLGRTPLGVSNDDTIRAEQIDDKHVWAVVPMVYELSVADFQKLMNLDNLDAGKLKKGANKND